MGDERPLRIGALLFPQFELLDIFGPLEMLSGLILRSKAEVVVVAEQAGPVPSAQGPQSIAEAGFAACPPLDVLLVPGGMGTREQAKNPAMASFLRKAYPGLEVLASVCTGAALLAVAGLLDGKRATSNKKAFDWVASLGPKTHWVPEARWVEDGNIITAGGVAAGMDMALRLVERLAGAEVAARTAEYAEYEWQRDPNWDPFARLAGLV